MTRPSSESETVADTSAGTGRARVEPGLPEGGRLGRYLVLDRLGAGGMGVVYAAYDPELDRKVAVKVLAYASERARERLLREARAMARLSHPNVVTVLDVGRLEPEGEAGSGADVFVAMEYVDGSTLKHWLANESAGFEQICRVFVAAGRGLVAAHAQGLVHRDFKPDNVMIASSGRVRVMDFGLARGPGTASLADVDPSLAEISTVDDSRELSLTRTGSVLGTPAYMSPEQHLGLEAGPASDQFSFCIAFWEAVHGERPFGGNTMAALAAEVTAGRRAEPPRDAKVPTWLSRTLDRGLEPTVEDRWGSMEALLEAVEAGLQPRRQSWRVPAAMGAIGLGAFAFTMSGRPDPTKAQCEGGAATAAKLWNADLADQVRTRFEASGLSFATAAAERADTTLSEFAQGYGQGIDGACSDTQVTKTKSPAWMDARVACLEEQGAEVGAIIETSLQADAALVERSASVFKALPNPADCADPSFIEERLRGDMAPRPDEREAVQQAREALAVARGRHRAGDYPGARAAFVALTPTVESLAFRPLEAEFELAYGSLDYDDGRTGEAATHNERAVKAALAGRHTRVLSEGLAALAAVRARDPESRNEAGHLIDYAEAAAEGSPQSDVQRADLFSDRGLVHDMSGDFAAAELAHREALALREAKFGVDDPRVAEDLHNLGIVLRLQKKTDDARATFERALQIRIGAYGEAHPESARSLNSLANLEFRTGDLDAARAAYLRVLDAKRAAFGGEHVSMANGYSMLGVIARRQGDLGSAAAYGKQAVELAQGKGADARTKAKVGSNYGTALMMQERFDEALAVQRQSLAAAAQAFGETHPTYASFLTNAAGAARKAEDLASAETWLRSAVELRTELLDADDSRLAVNRFELAQVLAKIDEAEGRAQAASLATQAWLSFQRTGKAPDRIEAIEAFMKELGAKPPPPPQAGEIK